MIRHIWYGVRLMAPIEDPWRYVPKALDEKERGYRFLGISLCFGWSFFWMGLAVGALLGSQGAPWVEWPCIGFIVLSALPQHIALIQGKLQGRVR